MSIFTELPTELLDPILFALRAADLANLALCSRALHALITPYLYRAPSLLLTNKSKYTSTASSFLECLLRNAHLGALVRNLQIKTRKLTDFEAWGRSRREYDTILGDAVLGYVLGGDSGGALEPRMLFDHCIEEILEKCTNLRRFEIGDKSFSSYFTYAFEYHSSDVQEETTKKIPNAGSDSSPSRRLKSVTISFNGSEDWASSSYSGLRIPFDHLPALLLSPGLCSLAITNLSNNIKIPSLGPDLHLDTYWRTVFPFSQDPNPSPSMSITNLAFTKTLILPRTLKLILALTPRLRSLEYDCWMDFYFSMVETAPFPVSDLNAALLEVQRTLRSLKLKVRPFGLPLWKADGSGGEVEWLRGGDSHEPDSADAEDSTTGQTSQYLDLSPFAALRELDVQPVMPFFYGQRRRMDTTGLATVLPPSLERLHVTDTMTRQQGCSADERWTEEDMLHVLSSLARDERKPKAFERLELDIRAMQESWTAEQAQDLETAYQEVGLECEVLSKWTVVLSEVSKGPAIVAHHC